MWKTIYKHFLTSVNWTRDQEESRRCENQDNLVLKVFLNQSPEVYLIPHW